MTADAETSNAKEPDAPEPDEEHVATDGDAARAMILKWIVFFSAITGISTISASVGRLASLFPVVLLAAGAFTLYGLHLIGKSREEKRLKSETESSPTGALLSSGITITTPLSALIITLVGFAGWAIGAILLPTGFFVPLLGGWMAILAVVALMVTTCAALYLGYPSPPEELEDSKRFAKHQLEWQQKKRIRIIVLVMLAFCMAVVGQWGKSSDALYTAPTDENQVVPTILNEQSYDEVCDDPEQRDLYLHCNN